MSASFKFTRIINILIIIFPILFALNIYTSLNKENTLNLSQTKYTQSPSTEEECEGTMLVNISFAVILAALWNGKRVLKIGAI
jgi:hypothetical protein